MKLRLPTLLAILLPALAAIGFLVWLVSTLPSEADKQVSRARDDLRALRSVLLLSENMPDTAAGLEALVLRGDIPHLPRDPWGQPYQYRHPGKTHPYDLFSLGPDGVESGDDIVVWNLYGGR